MRRERIQFQDMRARNRKLTIPIVQQATPKQTRFHFEICSPKIPFDRNLPQACRTE
jgi:hypothetical protein